jgi:hypothetical protein
VVEKKEEVEDKRNTEIKRVYTSGVARWKTLRYDVAKLRRT